MAQPIEKQDPTFGERFVAPLITIFVAAPLLGFPAAMYWQAEPKHYWRAVPFAAVLIGMVGGLGLLHHRVLGRYRCPQCGRRLPRLKGTSTAERAREYRFQCENCNVLWHTALKEGED
jgi:hypothetical protein